MKQYLKNNFREILLTVATVLFALLICCALILVKSYTNGLDKQAEDSSKKHSVVYADMLNGAVDEFVNSTKAIAEALPTDKFGTEQNLQEIKETDREAGGYIADIFTVYNGEVHRTNGAPYEENISPYLLQAISKNEIAVSGLVTIDLTTRGFYVYFPLQEGHELDAIAVFYKLGALESKLKYFENQEVVPEFVGVCNDGGEIFNQLHTGSFDLKRNDNLFDKMRKITNDKSSVDELLRGIKNNYAGTVRVNGEKFVVSIDTATLSNGNLYTVTVYKNSNIYKEGYQIISAVYAIVVILSLFVAFVVIYILISKFRDMHKTDEEGMVDTELECPTLKKFLTQTDDYLAKNKITKFAVIYVKIQHYEYIEENFGKELAVDTLKFVAKLFSKSLLIDETFCRYDNADFMLFFHYREKEDIISRLKVFNVLCFNCPKLVEKGYGLKLSMGAYFIEREKELPVQKMIEYAIMAERSREATQVGNVRVYEQRLHDMFLHEAEIEAKMEAAITNGEFEVFFQPKYSLAQDRIDGAEALVRWYDPENNKYRQPGEFIRLFEANSFIATLDKYVFVEVCKYLQEATARGDKIVPISVNVSRVTAIQYDFLEFYINNKRKYGVADNFLMIEFTENFAYENYDTLKKLVFVLRDNGFRCSIDDFGSGYSSFNILKELPMNELKLDKFFIKSGISQERDDILLKTVVDLAKKMGMTVTQEGVETINQVHYLKNLGCDLIQGYIYAKPLKRADYEEFIKDGRLPGV